MRVRYQWPRSSTMILTIRPLLAILLVLAVARAAQAGVATDELCLNLHGNQQAITSTAGQSRSLNRENDCEPIARDHSDLDPLEDMRKALEVMQSTWFELWVGAWPTSIDWTGAVLNTHVVATLSSLSKALDVTKRSHNQDDLGMNAVSTVENELNLFFAQTTAYYFGENAFALRNEAFDDMLWVFLGWLESVKFINTHSRLHYRPVMEQSKPWHGSQYIDAFAHRARVFYDLASHGWDTKLCGGGMVWNPYKLPYKNAITNQLFITASVSMYLYSPGDKNTSPFMSEDKDEAYAHDPKYLEAAIAGYEWLANSNMTNAQGLYVDGFHIKDWGKNHSIGTGQCDERNEMVFTYNQGVVLSGLRGLWEATGNSTYLGDGHSMVRNTIAATGWLLDRAAAVSHEEWQGLGRAGIIEDICDSNANCDQDAHTFKGIYFHHLTLFCEPLPAEPLVPGKTHVAGKALAMLHRQSCKDYAIWVAHNARAAVSTRDDRGRFGSCWGAGNGYVDRAPMPEGAVDYRNNASELLRPSQLYDNHRESLTDLQLRGASLPVRPIDVPQSHKPNGRPSKQDANDRGRGRTVEAHSGGVAVLHALWELLEQT
jgi:hypothetical protein